MATDIAGRARRASMVTTFGVGSLFPAENDSVMVCGIDGWDPGDEVTEPRLAESLGAMTFHLPAAGRRGGRDIPVVRFPEWAFCPGCRRLDRASKLTRGSSRRCRCNAVVSPSRFVVCCENGHIDDFPYYAWVHRRDGQASEGHELRLETRGESSALADLVVACECGRSRSMDGAFDIGAMRGIKWCSGRRPWLPSAPKDPQSCDLLMRTLQRGSSNVWFASTRSAISIPSVRARARSFVEKQFKRASADADPEQLAELFTPPPGCSKEDVVEAIREMRVPRDQRRRPSDEDLRAEEYRALLNGLEEGQDGSDQFLCAEVDLTDSGVPTIVAQVSRVSRLREVRALAGFSRVTPSVATEEEDGSGRMAPLSAEADPEWLPALEVLGEGVFVRLDEDVLQKWCESDFARRRARLLLQGQDALPASSLSAQFEISPRSLVLHSLAHVLVDECSLSAGYPTASLRERVYDREGQAGVLIYTATADSAGSLGGLAALSDKYRFEGILRSAVERARWCTSDPVCIESGPTGVDGMNLCACHACLLLPETSCERFNLVLDRACLVGTPERGDAGLLSVLH